MQGMTGRGDALLPLMGVPVTFHFGGGNHPHRTEPLGVQDPARDLSQKRGAMEAETGSGLRNGEDVGIRCRIAHNARIPGETVEDKGLTYYINRSKMSTSGSCS